MRASAVIASVGVPSYGPAPGRVGIPAMAEAIEEAGFDGAWLTDHIVLIDGPESQYPYAADGSFFLDASSDWYESVTSLAAMAARTERIELGIGVLVLPLRNPVVLAKQLATIDRLSGGRVRLAIGAGWLREEFVALSLDPSERGPRTDAAIDVLRACWEGSPPAGEYGPFTLPAGVHCRPTPERGSIDILVGGHSPAAIRRTIARGDGWFAAASHAEGPTPDELAAEIEAGFSGRHPPSVSLRFAVEPRALGTDEMTELLQAYVAAGVERFVFDFGWRSLEQGKERLAGLAQHVALLPRSRESRCSKSDPRVPRAQEGRTT